MPATLPNGTVPRKKRKQPLMGIAPHIKAAAVTLAEQTQNNHLAAETFGVDESSVRLWRKTLTPEEIARGAETLAQEWEERAFRFLAQADALSTDATFMQLITAASIATEKRTLLRGKDNQGVRSPADPDVLRDKLKALLLERARDNATDAVVENGAGGEEGSQVTEGPGGEG